MFTGDVCAHTYYHDTNNNNSKNEGNSNTMKEKQVIVGEHKHTAKLLAFNVTTMNKFMYETSIQIP